MAFPVDEQYIAETEKDLKLKFSSLFREKMKTENSGQIETDEDSWTIYPFLDKSDPKRFRHGHILVLQVTLSVGVIKNSINNNPKK